MLNCLKNPVWGIVFLSVLWTACSTSRVPRSDVNEMVENLKNGCLIVRLPSAEQKISYFEKQGWNEKASAERAFIKQRSKELMQAFEDEYTFSKVYFMHVRDAQKLSDGRMDEVQFFNKNVEYDPSIKPECEHIFTATYGTSFLTENGYVEAGEAITICDSQFRLMKSPFPSRSNKYFVVFKKTDVRMIERLNRRLEQAAAR